MDLTRAMLGLVAQGVPFQPPRGAPIFEHLGEAETELLRQAYVIRGAARDQTLIGGGDPAPPVITLLSGWAIRYSVLLDGRRHILGVLLPGDTVGLEGLLEFVPAHPVQCVTPVTFGEISFPRACKLAGEAEWFRRLALEALSRGREAAEVASIRFGQCTAEERLVATLLELSDRLDQRGLVIDGGFALPLSQPHLADLIGVTPVHLGRLLSRLKSRGLLAADGTHMTLSSELITEAVAAAPRVEATRPVFPGALLV